jgi:hypothetical protein
LSLAFVCWLALSVAAMVVAARAHDDGNHDPAMHAWFERLASGKGLCCSFADGRTVEDPDVDMQGDHYRVRVDGVWYDVPDKALVTEPNRLGQAVVWPYVDADGKTQIRCFLPGGGA